MIGAGYLRDMVKTTQLNRSLLKGNDAGTFNNFDREAYLGGHKTKTVPTYKEASPELLQSIRLQMQQDNLKTNIIKEAMLLLLTLLAVFSFSTLLF